MSEASYLMRMMKKVEKKIYRDPLERPEVRWGLGCLLGAAAMIGLVILTFLIAVALEPPTWVQVLLGIGLVGAGGALTVLVAVALGQSRGTKQGLQATKDPDE